MNRTADIILEDVYFAYNGAPVLQRVSLSIPPGDFACIVGPNGSGKTTLLKLILGLLQPQKGAITILGAKPAAARTRIGYTTQHAVFDVKFPITVFEVVLMGRLHKTRRFGPYSKEDKEAALRTLEEVEAVALRRRMLSELSSGQRQRVLIARALACDPEMMVLDEPTIGLDAAIEHSFYELLGRINERMTVLVVSHDLSFVSSYVRTVVCMDVNRTVHVHATSDLTDDMMAAVYGRNVRMIRHDHHDQCSHEEEDAQHGPEDRQ